MMQAVGFSDPGRVGGGPGSPRRSRRPRRAGRDFGAVRVLVSLHASHLRAWHQLPLAWGVVAENGCLLGFFPGGMRALDLIHAMKNR